MGAGGSWSDSCVTAEDSCFLFRKRLAAANEHVINLLAPSGGDGRASMLQAMHLRPPDSSTPAELDFLHEAHNSARCASNLDSKRSRVRGRVAVSAACRTYLDGSMIVVAAWLIGVWFL